MANSNKIVDLAALTRFKEKLDALLDEYATRSEIAVIGQNADAANNRSLALQNGDIAANKATCDGSGNNIANTYAKKSEIPASATVDSALSTTSTNPVQNKVITAKVNQVSSDVNGIIDGDITVGMANKAAYDTDGKSIKSTYAKATDVNSVSSEVDRILAGDLTVGKASSDSSGNNIVNTYATKSATYKTLYNSTLTMFGASNRVHIMQYGTTGVKILIVCGKTSAISDGSSISWSINTTIRSYGFTASNISIVALQANTGGVDQYRNGVCVITNSTSSVSLRNSTNTTSSFNFIAIGIAS